MTMKNYTPQDIGIFFFLDPTGGDPCKPTRIQWNHREHFVATAHLKDAQEMVLPHAGAVTLPPTRFALKARPYFIGLLAAPGLGPDVPDGAVS